MNPTNPAFDSLKRVCEIPPSVKSLSGKQASVQGYIKPLKRESNGCIEFLLLRNYALCCQTNVPKVNEWIHIRMTNGVAAQHLDRSFTVRGVLQVG